MAVTLTEVEEMDWEEVCGKRFGYVLFEVSAEYLGGVHTVIKR